MCKILNMFKKDMDSVIESSNKRQDVITIERFCYAPQGTFGHLSYKEFSCYTVERPWKNNEPFVSCIPDGEYTCEWYDSPRFGRTLAIIGGTVSLFPSPQHDRSAILFHVGNWPHNFEGCIGLGRNFTCINGKLGVSSSASTVEAFLNLFSNVDDIPLKIINSTGASI